jgi:hypothetical protein
MLSTLLLPLVLPAVSSALPGQDDAVLSALRTQKWIQIPGVEPILRGPYKEADMGGHQLEMGDIIRDFETYYLYFHGALAGHPGCSIGVATAPSPLGPWKLHNGGEPILIGDQPWERGNVAMGSIVKRGVSGDTIVPPLRNGAAASRFLGGRGSPPPRSCPPWCDPGRNGTIRPDPPDNAAYYMWYSAENNAGEGTMAWNGGDNTGLATAPHPLGPWTKVKLPQGIGGPVMNLTGEADFPGNREGIYNSQMVELANGSFLMYGETMGTPGAAAQMAYEEYLGGVGIWRADRPEGPFQWVGFGPLSGGFGSWNDGGTSGASVRLLGSGVYEMWFSGAKMRKNPRVLPREEDAGVAYSLDGVHWQSGADNPVMLHRNLPGPASAMSEVHVLYEHPFRYIYHTLRWLTDDQDNEDLGVEIMLPAEDAAAGFRLLLPLSSMDGSAPLSADKPLACGYPRSGAAVVGAATPGCIATEHIHHLAFTTRWVPAALPMCAGGNASYNFSLSLRTSLDGSSFDDEPAEVLWLHGRYPPPPPPPPPPSLPPCTRAKDTKTNCNTSWHCSVCLADSPDCPGCGPRDCLSCVPGFTFHRLLSDCTGFCHNASAPPSPPPCTPAESSKTCNPAWHCSTCRVGASSATDCLSCPPSITFHQHSSDCTGVCGGETAPPSWHERSTAAVGVGELAGRFLSVEAAIGKTQGGAGCALGNFTVLVTLIADAR